ncbi:MAG TPA: ABC transporter permease [Kofleriaceae bacterium]|nr:ABC transporter permease [Kofleriaceae bacterium]
MPGILRPTIEKEILLLKRDPRVLVRLIVMPVAFIALFGMAFKGQERRAKELHPVIVFRDLAASRGVAIVEALKGSGMFNVVEAKNAEEVRAKVEKEDFDVGVVIDHDFDPLGGRPAHLVIDKNGPQQKTQPLIGSISAIATRAFVGGPPPPKVVDIVDPTDPAHAQEQASPFQLTVPGNAVLFGFFIALTCALGFAEERRSGTWRRLLAAPVPAWKLLVAKLVPYVALGMIQVGTLFAIGVFAFGMKIQGSVIALAVLTFAVACAATACGLMIASFSSTEKQISSLGSVLILIMGLVGGCMFPRMLMPHVMQQIGLGVPHGWALDGYYTLLVRSGAGFADVMPQIGAVFGFAALFALIGLRRFRFDT